MDYALTKTGWETQTFMNTEYRFGLNRVLTGYWVCMGSLNNQPIFSLIGWRISTLLHKAADQPDERRLLYFHLI